MRGIGIIGLGDMGTCQSTNVLKTGLSRTGFDLLPAILDLLQQAGGTAATSIAQVGKNSDSVFVMMLNGKQALVVMAGEAA